MERITSDYRFKDFRPQIKLFDLIPVIGLVTPLERDRKELGQSPRSYYLGDKFTTKEIAKIATFGVASWPDGTNRAANIRSCILATRNAAFAVYHLVVVPTVLLQTIPTIEQLAQRLSQ